MGIPVILLSTKDPPSKEQVGSKGLGLIQMTLLNIAVPPGFILPVSFFHPWIDILQNTPEWSKILDCNLRQQQTACKFLQELSTTLPFTPEQTEALEAGLAALALDYPTSLFAVRSSAPDEDLSDASFAGIYETSLGVTQEKLKQAINHSFASCLDERIILYKKEHGFEQGSLKIAVIIQQQLAADTAGVAFSLNPLSNCYDEAVINANYGLGESVVSGRATPDLFIVDKPAKKILEREPGKKELSIWLDPKGGLLSKAGTENCNLCLTDDNVSNLVEMLIQLENHFRAPVDIEWAFVNKTLYLLQVRPITTFIPLPDVMQTKPGASRRLYLDVLLAGQGIDRAFSVAGIEFYSLLGREMIKDIMGGEQIIGIRDGFLDFLGGRSYLNLSNTLRLPARKKTLAGLKTVDVLTVKTIEALDLSAYIPKKLPRQFKWLIRDFILNLFHMRYFPVKLFKAFRDPVKYHQFLRQQEKILIQKLDLESRQGYTPKEFALKASNHYLLFGQHVMPALFLAEIARSGFKKLPKLLAEYQSKEIACLEQAIPGNVTIEMGLALFNLSRFKEIELTVSAQAFVSKLRQREFTRAFMEAWDNFMTVYGFRCPIELDVAQPRFAETPSEIYRQLRALSTNTENTQQPQMVFEQAKKQREKAFNEIDLLLRQKGRYQQKRFQRQYRIFMEFSVYREIPKYYAVMILGMIRKQLLTIGQSFVESGRLNDRDQVFNLTITDLENGLADKALDLKSLVKKNTLFLNKIKWIKSFPRFIDSRGQILRPPRKEVTDDEIGGEAISPGIVVGKVKVLNHPEEKTILPGEILVTRATDPGWTPLFLNAAGIILEVGGILQHGALVAREYGKPCIAGIENVTSLLQDGDLVELDGTNGRIRLLKK